MKTRNISDNYNRYIRSLILIIGLLLFCGRIYGQATTQGKDFWIAFGSNNASPYSDIVLQVRIVATKAANVKFTFTETGYTETISLTAGSVYTKNLSDAEKEAVYADWIDYVSQKSLHIESDEDIAVYAINLDEATTDATCILPVKAYGVSYYHLSYRFISMGNDSYDGYVIVANEDNTNIYVNDVWIATLDNGGVYSDYFTDDDIRHIISDKPIAYFTTNPCTEIYLPACDCMYEQLLPESLWGLSYMVPVTKRGKERIRIYASQDDTKVKHVGGTVIAGSLNLDKGEYLELEISRDQKGCYIEADKPVAVISYLIGTAYSELTYHKGDPAMAWIPAIDQFVDEATIAPFIAAGSSVLNEHHILIITPTKDKNLTEIRIGNNSYSSLSGGTWIDHSSGYSYYLLPLSNEDLSYSLKNPAGLATLGYGLGDAESYYYLAGSALRKLDASFYVNDIHYQDLEANVLCTDELNVEVVVHYNLHKDKAHLRWIIDDVEATDLEDKLEWSKKLSEGTHKISMIVKNEYRDVDTLRASLLIELSEIELVDTTIVCQWEKVILEAENASDEFAYLWFYDANYTNTIVKSSLLEATTGVDTIFYLEAISPNGCILRDSSFVAVIPLPELSINKDTSVCYNSVFTPQALSSDAVTLRWYSDINYTNTIVEAASFETAPLNSDTVFYIEALSDKGCRLRDNIEVTIDPLPRLTVEDKAICFGFAVELFVSNHDEITYAWYSDNLYSKMIKRNTSFSTSPLETDTVFYIEATSDKNCKLRDSSTITLIAPPKVVAMDDGFICYGEEIRLDIHQSEGQIRWNVDMETVSPTSTQQYIVTASRPPCPDATDTVTITVGDSLYIQPSELAVYKPDVDYLQELTTNAESPVFTIINNSLPAGLGLSSTGTISGLAISDGNYEPLTIFTVQAEDKSGCKTQKEYTLKRETFIPRAFTPNNDGINDVFMKGYKIIITDRLGMEMFRGDDGWDGTFNGKTAPQDIYYYILDYKDDNGTTAKRTGYVGLINREQFN